MSEILSQEEIDALLSAYSTGSASGGKNPDRPSSHEVRLYDFTRPERFSKDQIRQLEAVSNTFASSLSNHLAAILRSGIDIQHTTLDQASFDEYLKSIPTPTLTSTFRMEPVGAKGIIEINPNIAFAVIDLLTGGNGDAMVLTRDLTDIEVKLMEGVTRTALNEYESAWRQFVSTTFPMERVGSNQMVNPIARPQDRMLNSYFEAKVGQQVGLISICMPIMAVETILNSFATANSDIGNKPNDERWLTIADNLSTSEVFASARLGETSVSVRDLLNLQEGDFIRLDQTVDREITIAIQDAPKYLGVPGIVGRKMGIHITRDIFQDSGISIKESA